MSSDPQSRQMDRSCSSKHQKSVGFVLSTPELREYVSVPQVVFVGMQTSGKSSLVEALVGLPFNFTGTGIATRVPLEISSTSTGAAPCAPHWHLRWDPPNPLRSRSRANLSTKRVRAELDDIHAELTSHELVCSVPVSLQLHWKRARNLTFIDLPGFKGNARDDHERVIQSEIFSMNQDIILSKRDETFVVVEPASSDASNYIAHQTFKDIVQDEEVGKSVVLVCSKFDLVKDVPELHDYLSDYIQYVRESFVLSCPHGEDRARRWDEELRRCNMFDTVHSSSISEEASWNRTGFGIENLAVWLENLVEQRLLDALPIIRRDLKKQLGDNAAMCAKYRSEEAKSTHKWIQKHLNAHVVEFTIALIRCWDARCLQRLPMRTRAEEHELLEKCGRVQRPTFHYQRSPVWLNPEYRSKTQALLLWDCPLAGSAQIRRLLREFEVSLFTRVMNLDENFKLILQNKVLSIRSGDGSCVAWNEVIVEIVRDMSVSLLSDDIAFLSDSVLAILEDWGQAIAETSIPSSVREQMLSALSRTLRTFLDESSFQMHKFIESAITTATHRAVPKAGATISELHELCMSLYDADSSAAVNRQLGNIGVTVTDLQVGKAKRLCMERLNLGVTVISQTLGAIFDSFFTSKFRTCLTPELVSWEREFTAASTNDVFEKKIAALEKRNDRISLWLQTLEEQ